MSVENKEFSLLIIFDFDGVLADSQEAYAMQMFETVEFFTNKQIPMEVFKQRGGNTDQRQDFIEFLETDDPETIDKAIIYYVSLTEKYSYLRELYPNVSKTLESLKEKYILGIVSRKSQERLMKWLRHFKITHLFDKFIGTLEQSKCSAIQEIMADFNIPSERTLMVGDTEFDIISAQEAGISSVLALYGAEKMAKALALSPTYTIQSVEDVIEIARKHIESI